MMIAFVDKCVSIAVDISNAAYKYARREATFEEVAAVRNVLRTHLEAREAVTAQLAEALRSCWDLGIDKHMVEQVRAALQAYDEANNDEKELIGSTARNVAERITTEIVEAYVESCVRYADAYHGVMPDDSDFVTWLEGYDFFGDAP